MHLYLYYDVPHEASMHVRTGIKAMQQRLAGECGVQGRLLCRIDDGQLHETWMEIYEQVDDAFETKLTSAFAQSGLRNALIGPRHLERFADFD